MKKVTKEIILDLLPLYIAGEVSEDTTTLVKEYLETDPELSATAKEMAKAELLGKVPIPFKKETAMETYEEAKKWMTIRLLGFATLGTVTFLCTLFLVFAYFMTGR